MVAVTVLIERGLALRGSPLVLGLAALAPAAAFVTVAVWRSLALGPQHSAGMSRATVVVAAGAVVLLATAAAVSVLGGA